MLIRIINFFRGYLVIEASGFFIERFINLAIRSKIYLWDIEKTEQSKARMKLSIAGFHRIRKAAFRTKTKVKIKEKRGLPLILHRHRKRKAFYVGIAVFTVIVVFLTSFIWSVEIDGLEKIDKNTIRDALRSCGIDAGVVKYNHDLREIQDEMMKQVPQLSWIWVEIRGTRAIVSVKERTLKPDIVSDAPRNIVASRDGVILRTVVRDGKRMVSEGDVVKKGQLLISGVEDSAYSGVILMHSDGEIYAATWHEKSGEFPLAKTLKNKTGSMYKRYSVTLGDFNIQIFPFKRNPYGEYETSEAETALRLWGDLYLPLKFKTEIIEETVSEVDNLTPEDAAQYYSEMLYDEIEKELSDNTKVTDRTMTYTQNESGITLKCTVTCDEEIGEVREIETKSNIEE